MNHPDLMSRHPGLTKLSQATLRGRTRYTLMGAVLLSASISLMASAKEIIHDADYYVLKEQCKLYVPAAGENPIGAKFYDLYRDTREELPVSTEIGAWGGTEFVRIIQRHKIRKQKFPDEEAARGVPYDGVENQRPETEAAVEAFYHKRNATMQ